LGHVLGSLFRSILWLVRYATEPMLYIIQELLTGGSLDKQLYTERWRPDPIQLLQGALDIARGVEHLHTHFERGGQESKRCTSPVIHRDLKSPNILLDRPPPLGKAEWAVEMKVSDFGLSRDKAKDMINDETVGMTVCGSVLWMAPEMLRGDNYNEAADVYSFAMCLIELSHCTMPWQDTGAQPHEIPVSARCLRSCWFTEPF
jgi:serine/threonine protein kinase